MQNAVPKYDGVKVYVNHPKSDDMGESRSFHDWAGVVPIPATKAGTSRATFTYGQKSPNYAGIIEAAEKFPNSVGMC